MFRQGLRSLSLSLSAALVLFALTWAGCGSEEKQIRKVVEKYNQSLPYAYEASTDILRQVATDREQGRLDIFKNQLADQQKKIKIDLVSLKIGDIKILPAKQKANGQGKYSGKGYKQRKGPQMIDPEQLSQATAQTEEVWKYRHVDLKSLKPLGEWARISYQATYTLVRIEGDWFVHDLKFKEKILQ